MKALYLALPASCWMRIAFAVTGYDYAGLSSQHQFWINEDREDVTIAQMPSMSGRGFAAMPITDCFSPRDSTDLSYDIAILGAPHDTTTTGRPGARFGPFGIRTGSMQKTYGLDIHTGRNAFNDWAKIVDCGDAPMTWLDNRAAIKSLDKAHRLVSGRPAASLYTSSVPRIIMLGGDHTTTLSALRSTHEHWGPVSVIHFDSHIDTWDPNVLGGGISEYAALNHGTFLHFAHEEHLILNSSIHAGIRAGLIGRSDIKHDSLCGFHVIKARDIDTKGIKGVIDMIRERVGDSRIYISVDIDVLDPAFAPATGTPEPGGWSTRELLTILAGLEGLPLVGGDIVEVAPAYDTNAATTALAAAEIAAALVDLLVATPVKA